MDKYRKHTLSDFKKGVIWDQRKLAIPHLPYIFPSVNTEIQNSLASPARPKSQLPLFSHKRESSSQVWAGPATETFVRKHFSETGLYIEDMPIKVPHGIVHIPDVVLNCFSNIIDSILSIEEKFNPYLQGQYLYLTIQQSYVKKDTSQRKTGIHLDGFQKSSIFPQVAQHQLAITNAIPTRFVCHSFDVEALPADKKGLFKALNEQSIGLERHEPQPYRFHLLNAFCPHEPGFATKDCFRTFVRFSGSCIPFMGADNTRNPLLKLEWDETAKRAFYESITRV